MRKTFSIFFLLLISTFSITFSQVVIKEKVDIIPNSNHEIVNSISYGGCSYDYFESTSLQVKFIPSEIRPGDTAIVQLWIVTSSGYSYRYYDDNSDLLEESIKAVPSYGTLTRIDSTQYRFIAADTLTADSVNVTVNYENYNQACIIFKSNSKDTTERKANNVESGCIDCGFYGPSLLLHVYGSGKITIKKPKVQIILDKPPPYRNDVYITAEPKMPDVICKAKMNDYEKGKVKFRWAYWITSDFPRRNKDENGNYYDLCHRISQSVFLGYSYANNEDTTKWTVPFLRDSG